MGAFAVTVTPQKHFALRTLHHCTRENTTHRNVEKSGCKPALNGCEYVCRRSDSPCSGVNGMEKNKD